jgi:integrase
MGTIDKLPNGRYKARWRTAGGASRSKTFAQRKQAVAHLNNVGHSQGMGTYVDPGDGKVTLGRFVDTHVLPTMKGARSTLARNRSYLRSLILPTFSDMALVSIDYTACQQWVNHLERAGRSPETVHKAAQIMGRIMKTAIKARRLQVNPMVDVELTPIGDHEATFLEPTQVETLADAMEAVEPRYRALVWVGCYCGPRIGELIALRWSDFNLLKGTVSIVKNTTDVAGVLEDGPTKTKAGRRIVPVPERVVKELERHRELFPPGPDDRVFTAPQGGPIRANNLRRRAWADATLRAGLAQITMVERRDRSGKVLMDKRKWKAGQPRMRSVVTGMTFHDMRHTAVSIWISMGANDLQVAKWAGHRSVTFTKDRYGHLFPSDGDLVIARMDALIAEASAAPRATVIGLDRKGR